MTLGGIGGIVIKHSRFSYQDMTADHVGINIGHVATGIPVPVRWNFDLATAGGARPIALSGNATLEYGARTAHLSGLDAKIDDSTLRGDAAVTNLTTGAMNFDLAIDHIDLDRYLGSPSKPKAAAQPTPPPAAAQSQQPTELPTSALKTLQLQRQTLDRRGDPLRHETLGSRCRPRRQRRGATHLACGGKAV